MLVLQLGIVWTDTFFRPNHAYEYGRKYSFLATVRNGQLHSTARGLSLPLSAQVRLAIWPRYITDKCLIAGLDIVYAVYALWAICGLIIGNLAGFGFISGYYI